MSRRFGKVIGTLWASKRFRSLPDDVARLAYIYLHTNTHGNCVGAYRLPAAYLAADVGVSQDQAGAALAAMERVGLIRYDAAESIILIEDWWLYNSITNRKHLQAAISAIADMPRRCLFRPRVALEASSEMIAKARSWATDAKGASAATEALTMCRKLVVSTLGDATQEAMHHARRELPRELWIELSEALSIAREPFAFPEREGEGDADADKRRRQETETDAAAAENVEEIARTLIARGKAAR